MQADFQADIVPTEDVAENPPDAEISRDAPSFEAEAATAAAPNQVPEMIDSNKDVEQQTGIEVVKVDDAAIAPPIKGDGTPEDAAETATPAKPEEELGDPIPQAADMDILSGRGASVNNHPGNKKFRALCFVRKPLFDAGNHAAKRRITTEIVNLMMEPTDSHVTPSRFLKRKNDKSPYYAMTKEQAIAKAQQVMRDYKRPDRIALRENLEATGQIRKRNRTTVSTPIEEPIIEVPAEPIVENPFGVHAHDVLCGRGAYINGHIGNARLRELAWARKKDFDAGNYTDKRQLAVEIVTVIQSLDPPGRFLKRAPPEKQKSDEGQEQTETDLVNDAWEQLTYDKAIHKACQVMRDIDRPDRKHREERKEERKRRKLAKVDGAAQEPPTQTVSNKVEINEGETKDVEAEKAAAAVEVVDKALDGATTAGETVEI